MTTLIRGANWKLVVQGREHGVPHVHLWWPGGRAVLAIRTLDLLEGKPPSSLLVAARAWMREHREAVSAEWHRLNPR